MYISSLERVLLLVLQLSFPKNVQTAPTCSAGSAGPIVTPLYNYTPPARVPLNALTLFAVSERPYPPSVLLRPPFPLPLVRLATLTLSASSISSSWSSFFFASSSSFFTPPVSSELSAPLQPPAPFDFNLLLHLDPPAYTGQALFILSAPTLSLFLFFYLVSL